MKFSINTKICKINDNSLDFAKNLILNNELVAFPTETVYGLGAIATSDDAVLKIFNTKGRPQDNPLIVHVHSNYDITSLVYEEYDYVQKLKKAFLPGPLTLVYKSKGAVSKLVSCGLDTVAIRVPESSSAQEFLKAVNVPIAAPSANVSKHTSPVTAEHVYNDLNGKIELILDGGKCSGGIESTVLDVTSEVPVILRSGLITYDMIVSVVGKCRYSKNTDTEKVKSPGVKYSHYLPKCQTALFKRSEVDKAIDLYNKTVLEGKTPYFMADDEILKSLTGYNQLRLGKTGKDIASNLYFKLLEGEKIADVIIAFDVETGSDIDVGIMNRLEKACKRY